MTKKFMEGYVIADFIFIGSCAIALMLSLNNGVPWYITFGMYGLVAVGIDSVIDSAIKAKKEKNASKA